MPVIIDGWVGVEEIIDEKDLRNGRLPRIAADATFYDIIEWLKDEVPQIERHSFFTNVDVGFVGETMVVFSGVRGALMWAKSDLDFMIDAARLRHEDTDQQGRTIYEGSALARCALELAFAERFSPRKLYPGYDARHPEKSNPIGRVRQDWGSGPMYEFAAGVDPSSYAETDPATNYPTYRFFVDGEWLVFARTKKSVLKNGRSTVVPAWRLQGR